MPSDWLVYACLGVGLGGALVAGVFQSFSDFVMRSLLATRPVGGAEAMQMINREVFRSAFLAMFLALAPITLGAAAYAAFALENAVAALWIYAGAAIYILGVFLVTIAGNVPMNERLDAMDPESEATTAYWRRYGVAWTRLNHVRTVGSAATALCFLLAALALA